MNRLLGGVTNAVARPRHMYPVGLLFGLGFDTASEVALLVIAAGAGTPGCRGTQSSAYQSCSPPGCR